jgi:hypothetical protein
VRLSRESSLIDRFKGSNNKMIEDHHNRERRQWDEEKIGMESKLEEALVINSKLFDKVKRLE